MHATRAAVEEGILPGGGVAFFVLPMLLRKLHPLLEGDEAIGAAIVRRAIEAPLRKLCDNAGVEGSLLFSKCSNPKLQWDTMLPQTSMKT